MYYIAYKYETSNGFPITKLVVCKNISEYKRIKEIIEKSSCELIEFDECFNSEEVPRTTY